MTQQAYELDLRDCLDEQGSGWTQRTGVGQGTDIGPALTWGLQSLRKSFGWGKIKIPPGLWLMTTPPSPDDLSGMSIEGLQSMASKIVFNNAAGVAFYFSGANGYDGGGLRGLGILLESGLGDTNSYGILLRGDSRYQPDQMEFNDIYMSSVGGGSYWWDNFHVDGTARVQNEALGIPQGCRVGTLDNIQLFCARNVGLYLRNVVQFSLKNAGVYVDSGANANRVLITEGSTQVHGIGVEAAGGIVTNDATDVWIDGTKYA